jgi:hypothetical protein
MARRTSALNASENRNGGLPNTFSPIVRILSGVGYLAKPSPVSNRCSNRNQNDLPPHQTLQKLRCLNQRRNRPPQEAGESAPQMAQEGDQAMQRSPAMASKLTKAQRANIAALATGDYPFPAPPSKEQPMNDTRRPSESSLTEARAVLEAVACAGSNEIATYIVAQSLDALREATVEECATMTCRIIAEGIALRGDADGANAIRKFQPTLVKLIQANPQGGE